MGGSSGVKSDLFANSGTANGLESQYSGNATGINSTLTPTLQAESATPIGYTPAQMASQTTAAEQTAGGGAAGATGGAMLRAARTGNIGAAQPAISEASRNASQRLSQTNAGIQTDSADLGAKRQMQAQGGLGSLYGENVGAAGNALNASNSSLKDAGDLSNFWQQWLLNAQSGAAQAATGNLGK